MPEQKSFNKLPIILYGRIQCYVIASLYSPVINKIYPFYGEIPDLLKHGCSFGPPLARRNKAKERIFPPIKKNVRLRPSQQRKFIFFLKEGIMLNYCILDGQPVTTHLFSKTDFISSFNCLAPELPGGFHEFVEACTDCQLIAIPQAHYNYLVQAYPRLNMIHLNVLGTYFDFHNKYVLNLSDLSSFKRQKDFSEEFSFLYRYTEPGILESLLELPTSTIPRLS